MIAMNPAYLLYYLPVILGVSLVLSATRHELPSAIWRQWLNNIVWITFFLALVALVLYLLSLMI